MIASRKARLLIVDDHPVVRSGLRELFEREPDLTVCGEASSPAEALEAIRRTIPDLVISDLMFEGRTGLELTRQLAGDYPNVPVLMISMHEELLYARRALAAGAKGYVTKHQSTSVMLHAVREVLAGRTYVSEAVLQQMESATSGDFPLASPLEDLTDREMEIFMLMGQGFAPRHIAQKLSLSTSTIEAYRERLKEKLGIESSPMLLRVAISWCRDLKVY